MRTREITGDAGKLHRRFTYNALALIQIDAATRQRCTIQIKVAINQAEFSFAFVAEVANVILRRAILARVPSFEGRLNQLVEIFFLIAMAGKISSRCFFRHRRCAVVGREDYDGVLQTNLRINEIEQGSNLLIDAQGHVHQFLAVRSKAMTNVIVRRETYGQKIGAVIHAQLFVRDCLFREGHEQII